MNKKCFKCGVKKDLSKFYKHSEMTDGYLGKCKECAKKDVNKYRQNNLEQVRKFDRQRGKLPHRIKARKQYSQDHREERRQYSQANKKHIAKHMKQWRQDNKEEIAEWEKQYRQNNKEKIAGRLKQWKKTPAGKASDKAQHHNRRTLKKGLTLAIVQQVYADNIKKYGALTCYLCGKPIINGEDSLDHSTPLIRKGTNNYDNLGVAHLNCNQRKFTKTLAEWFNLKKF